MAASYSTSVKRCRQLSRSVVSALEQVGEHSESSVSCLALLGSDGIAGCNSAGAQPVDLALQAVTSGKSISSIAAGFIQFLLSILLHLIYGHLPAALFLPGSSFSAPISFRHFQPIVTQLGLGLGLRCPGIRHRAAQSHHSQLLGATHQASEQQAAEQCPAPGRHQSGKGDH
jgi:hypothetical protein